MFIGEVIVQRLNLQVLWTQPPPTDDAKVCGIGWRPDERILAIGKTQLSIQFKWFIFFSFRFGLHIVQYNKYQKYKLY